MNLNLSPETYAAVIKHRPDLAVTELQWTGSHWRRFSIVRTVDEAAALVFTKWVLGLPSLVSFWHNGEKCIIDTANNREQFSDPNPLEALAQFYLWQPKEQP